MTNGEKLCIDFPDMHYTLSEEQTRRVVTTIGVCASFDLDWWDAEYKESITKNDLGVDLIDREKAIEGVWNTELAGLDNKKVVDMLKDLPSVTPQPCEDAVSRKAVLDLIADYDLSMGQMVRGIHALPPVTPQLSSELEKNSKKLEKDFGELDCISRKSIKQKLQEHHDFFVNAYGGFSNLPLNDKSRVDEITNCIAMVVNEPPVTPQPRKGHWIKSRDSYGTNHYTCPFCEHDIATKYDGTWKDNYCSNCGANMKGEEE